MLVDATVHWQRNRLWQLSLLSKLFPSFTVSSLPDKATEWRLKRQCTPLQRTFKLCANEMSYHAYSITGKNLLNQYSVKYYMRYKAHLLSFFKTQEFKGQEQCLGHLCYIYLETALLMMN